MIVYGGQERRTTIAGQCARVQAAARAVTGEGLEWHGALALLLIEGAGLLQGIADLEMAAAGGVDAGSARQDALMAGLVSVAAALQRSWTSGFADQQRPAVDLPAPTDEPISVRRAEGFAYYALYPELYAAAAQRLPPRGSVIGLRSIGAALAPVAAAAARAGDAATVRPVGHPFGRGLAVDAALAGRIGRAPVVLVDEGPGLSGSSLGGAVDWLEAQGVPPDGIHILPGHDGAPGAAAAPRLLTRWAGFRRHVADLDAVIVAGPVPLARWFEDITGPASMPLEDLAGGRWRTRSPATDAAADPAREARKWRLVASAGVFRMKFVGLDQEGVDAFGRAVALGAAGLSPPPLALRYGMMLEPWIAAEAVGIAAPRRLDVLTRYLRFRRDRFPAATTGASVAGLAHMARFNLGACLGSDAADALLAPWNDARLARLAAIVRPVHVDGRLHAWEWLRSGGHVWKTDAVDHSQSHDLIGPQDIAWDVVGAIVEFELPADDASALAVAVDADADLVAFLTLAYCAFQAGWWSLAAAPDGPPLAAAYAARAVTPPREPSS